MMIQLKFAHTKPDLFLFRDHAAYIDYCLELTASKFASYESVSDLENNIAGLNCYDHIHSLKDPEKIIVLEKKTLHRSDYIKAWKCIMDGRVFSEHFAAGEATRLNLGTKYLINIPKDLTLNRIAELISMETKTLIPGTGIREQAGCDPADLLSLSLGIRHMLQYSHDIFNMSKALGYNPEQVLSKQKMLIIINETSADTIINDFIRHRFYGFSQQNIFFMIQESYHGISLENHEVVYNLGSPRRLHNHGHIAIQQTMDNQIFHLSENGRLSYLSSDQFGEILTGMAIKVSYNIEDLDYLTRSIDTEGMALALKQNQQGVNMVMEVVPNNPDAPQKGGMAAYDPIVGQDVIIESFQLNGIDNHRIKFLNKNINFYPEPFVAWEKVGTKGLNMHVAVKEGFVYYQPVIGDINFLLKTAFFTRENATSIKAWKSAITTPLAITCMRRQDQQKQFNAYARSFVDFT